MAYADSGGVRLYYEEAGRGVPVLFVHEFSGDLRSWDAQISYFSRRYRCVAFNARGYPPSDVPGSASQYSQALAVSDILAVMRHLKLPRAHVIGCSMGALAALHFGMRHPGRARSLTAIGAGAGSDPAKRRQFLVRNAAMARLFEGGGMAAAAQVYRLQPARVQLAAKDPRGYREFWLRFAGQSAAGHALTLRGLQARRPSLYSLRAPLSRMKVPTHVVVGDEDDSCLDPAMYMKRICPAVRLTVVPATGHVVNAEEPDLFNLLTDRFLTLVDSGAWRPRDPRALPGEGSRRAARRP